MSSRLQASYSSTVSALQNISVQESCVSRELGHVRGGFWIPSYQIPEGTSRPACEGDGWQSARNVDVGACNGKN